MSTKPPAFTAALTESDRFWPPERCQTPRFVSVLPQPKPQAWACLDTGCAPEKPGSAAHSTEGRSTSQERSPHFWQESDNHTQQPVSPCWAALHPAQPATPSVRGQGLGKRGTVC